MNLAQLLFDRASERPDAPFVLHDGGTITFGEMAELTSGMAALLTARGIKAGDHVALLCGNDPRFLAAWFGTAALGAVCVPLATYLIGDGLAYILQQSDSRLLLAEAELLREKQAGSPEALAGLELLALPEAEALRGQPPVVPLPQPAAAPATILYTSGTTGRPKGAVIPHEAYLAASRQMCAELGITAAERIMVVLPLFHANPQMYAVASALQSGCSLALRPKFSAGAFFDDARRFRATAFTYVGTILSILAKRVPGEVRDHGLRWCTGGGAPADVWRDVEARYGFSVQELYGMTETGGWTTLNRPGATRVGTVGRARADIEVAILDPEDRAVPTGQSGEICVRPRAPALFLSGYYKRPDLTWAAASNFWFHTGDRGRLDDEGYVTFEGRLKELIRKGGEMISPQEIELKLLEHPAIRDCAVVGVPDEILGDEIKAVVVLAGPLEPQEVRGFLEGKLPRLMLPRYVEVVEQIPKTPTEKIERHKMTSLTPACVDLTGRAKVAAQ